MEKRKQLILTVLTVVLGSALGLVAVSAADIIGAFMTVRFEQLAVGVVIAILVVCGLSVLIGSLHFKISEKLCLSHWLLIVITCAAPMIYAVCFRVDFLQKLITNSFAGAPYIQYEMSELASSIYTYLVISFVIARIVTVCIIKHLKKKAA